MKPETEVYPGPNPCSTDDHRIFALEHIGDEATKKVRIPLVCTACGTLIIHTITLK